MHKLRVSTIVSFLGLEGAGDHIMALSSWISRPCINSAPKILYFTSSFYLSRSFSKGLLRHFVDRIASATGDYFTRLRQPEERPHRALTTERFLLSYARPSLSKLMTPQFAFTVRVVGPWLELSTITVPISFLNRDQRNNLWICICQYAILFIPSSGPFNGYAFCGSIWAALSNLVMSGSKLYKLEIVGPCVSSFTIRFSLAPSHNFPSTYRSHPPPCLLFNYFA